MYNARFAVTLQEALDQPIVILQTENGFYDYANIYMEYNPIYGREMVAAFFRNPDYAEEHFVPDEYGKKWKCIVFDLPDIGKDFLLLN